MRSQPAGSQYVLSVGVSDERFDDARLMLAEVTGPAVIIGWSMGGGVGLLAAGHDPDLATGVLMAEGSPFLGETKESWRDFPVAPMALGLAEVANAVD